MNKTSDIKKIKLNLGEEINRKARMQPLTIQSWEASLTFPGGANGKGRLPMQEK